MPARSWYWFPAKRYCWGWGLPSAWQGWCVLLGFIGLVVVGLPIFPPHRRPIAYAAWVAAWSIGFVIVCWRKGEPARWRWGDDGGRGPG